jgi:lysozyme family protein
MTASSRADVIAAMNVLARRRANTADTNEQVVIDEALDTLAGGVQDLGQAALIDSVRIVARAADELEKVVASVRMAPFDHYLVDLNSMMEQLQNTLDALQALDRLPSVNYNQVDDAPYEMAMAGPIGAADAGPINSTRFPDLKDEYGRYFQRCAVRQQYQKTLDYYIARLVKFRPVYQDVGEKLGNGMPWMFIGIIHAMEGSFNFTTHLHNGDPLRKRTVHVPRNRPVAGQPPFTWRDSARDALQMKGYDSVTDWSVPHMLYLWEKYNGLGYRPRRVPSPYLWSFSTIYTAGKYVLDGKFDPNAVSQQCGAAVMLKTLIEQGT